MRTIEAKRWTTKSCDICDAHSGFVVLGERHFEPVTKGGRYIFDFEDVACGHCGFVLARHVPDDDFLNDYYRDAYSIASDVTTIPVDYDTDARLSALLPHLPPGSNVAEIGASTGAFCEALKKHGIKAHGYDPVNSGEQAIAGKYISSDARANKGTLDAAISYYVLEHVTDAKSWLAASAHELRPDGLLLAEVPDFAAEPRYSLIWEHFLHFTPRHLGALFHRLGFEALPSTRPSRFFGVVGIGFRKHTKFLEQPASPPSWIFDPAGAESAKRLYRKAIETEEQEDAIASRIADEILAAVKSKRPDFIAYWGANHYATLISSQLSKRDGLRQIVIDSSRAKIGLPHLGFADPVQSPSEPDVTSGNGIFVLCSPAWNAHIETQLRNIRTSDRNLTVLSGVCQP